MRTERVQTDELPIQYITDGEGPLVVLVHGFPDLAIGWRNQITAIAAAGYKVVAPDMRGYGGTRGPNQTTAYSIFSLVGDLVSLVEALDAKRAVIVGHDWGAAVAWHAALLRPDMFHAVMGMAVPFQPRLRIGPPTDFMRSLAAKRREDPLYLEAFAKPDSHRSMDADPETSLRKVFWAFDGGTPDHLQSTGRIAEGLDFLDTISDEAVVPPWMDEAHFQAYVSTFAAGGFERPLNWYRKIDANWSRTRWLQGCKIQVPAAFLVGERDPVRRYMGHYEETLPEWLTDFRGHTVVEGAGHWVQQEAPEAVNEAMLSFLWGLH